MAATFFTRKQATTDAVTLCKNSPQYVAAKELDSFHIDGLVYKRCCKIAKKLNNKPRKKPSIAWSFGEALLRTTDNKPVYYCYLYERQKRSQILPVINGNRPALEHLREVHQLDKEGNKVVKEVDLDQSTLESKVFTAVTTYDLAEFKRLLVRWMVYCFISFRMVENVYFRDLLAFVNTGLSSLLPRAAATIRYWIKEEYDKHKALLIDELQAALSDIHLSFDLWTSPNSYAIVSVYSHFINEKAFEGLSC